MATANQTLRRRAAWAALAPVMDEDALIEALWTQHDNMRGDSVSDIIGFIDSVAARHLLDAATRKRLYTAYFDALRQADDTLPIDPWPLMLQTRPSAAAPAAQPVPRYVPPPVYAAPPAVPVRPVQAAPVAAAVPPPPAAAPAPQEPPALPHQAVFAALAGGIVGGVRQLHANDLDDLVSDCSERFDALKLPAALRKSARDALSSTGPAAWILPASPDQLALLVHEMYVSLCEAVGPVGADQVLVQAVRQAEQRPEARQVPPSRFL